MESSVSSCEDQQISHRVIHSAADPGEAAGSPSVVSVSAWSSASSETNDEVDISDPGCDDTGEDLDEGISETLRVVDLDQSTDP